MRLTRSRREPWHQKRRRQQLAACKTLAKASRAALVLSTRHSSGLAGPHTHRTHLHSTQVDLSVEIATLIAALCTLLHTVLPQICSSYGSNGCNKDGIAARNGRCVLHGKRGPRRQQALGRRTGCKQAASRAPRPRRVRSFRNDSDAVERHGCTATRVVQRLDACDRAAMAYRPTRLRRRPAPSTRRSLRTGQQRRVPFLHRRRRQPAPGQKRCLK